MNIRKGLTSRLRHKVIVEQAVSTSDGAGGYSVSWQPVTTLWAAIDMRTGHERQENGQISVAKTYVFHVRYTDLISTDMRLLHDNRYFNIRSIENRQENNRALEIIAQEGVAI